VLRRLDPAVLQQEMALPKSKFGWVFVAFYTAVDSVLVYLAFTCTGWMCDLVELPAVIPFGILYLGLLRLLNPLFRFGSITYAPFTNWYFIVPTFLGNSVIFYWLGVGIGKLCTKLLRARSA
jgi:hypothetical protein